MVRVKVDIATLPMVTTYLLNYPIVAVNQGWRKTLTISELPPCLQSTMRSFQTRIDHDVEFKK